MNAKRNAIGLVNKHFLILGGELSDIDFTFKGTKKWKEAKLHALLTIQQIQISKPQEPRDYSCTTTYWEEVIKEIEKL